MGEKAVGHTHQPACTPRIAQLALLIALAARAEARSAHLRWAALQGESAQLIDQVTPASVVFENSTGPRNAGVTLNASGLACVLGETRRSQTA